MPIKPVWIFLAGASLGCGRATPPPDDGPPPIIEAFATTPDSVRLYYRIAGTGQETVLAPFALFAGNEEWVAGQPTARILVVEGAGHWPHYEQPEITLAALDQFLRGGWPEASRALPPAPH